MTVPISVSSTWHEQEPDTVPIPVRPAEPPPVDWVVTFDECWRTNTHRTPLPSARRCHPDGFVIIRSRATAAEVKRWADYVFGGEYAGLRPIEPGDHRRATWPLGCLAAFDTSVSPHGGWLGGPL